jgi:hypothetical protein
MLLGTLVSVCAVAGLLFLLLAVRRLRHRRLGSCAIHGTSALVFFLAAVAIGLLGVNLLTYHRLTREQPALEAQFKRAGDARYAALLTYPSGETQELALAGDEWQVDARVLKWTPFADILGFDTAYRLERISGRYADIARERDQRRTVYALNPPDPVDVRPGLRAGRQLRPMGRRVYGSAVYVPMSDGARYQVVVSQSGLVARPLNETGAPGGRRLEVSPTAP